MITIAQHVEELIEQWPLLKQGLDLGLLNTSAVARHLRPELERSVGERISEATILMAIRRYEAKRKTSQTFVQNPQDYLGDISLRSNLIDSTYTNSPTLQPLLGQLTSELPATSYLTISRGLMQTSVIFHKDSEKLLDSHLASQHREKQVKDLVSMTLQLKNRHGQVAGIIAYPLQILAWKGIPVVEFVSTYDELSIILRSENVEKAFAALNQALTKPHEQ